MEESVTYQAIIQKGKKQGRREGVMAEAQKMLLLAGQPKLGKPKSAVRAAVAAITDTARLESLVSRVYSASSWDELLKSK